MSNQKKKNKNLWIYAAEQRQCLDQWNSAALTNHLSPAHKSGYPNKTRIHILQFFSSLVCKMHYSTMRTFELMKPAQDRWYKAFDDE